MAFSIRHHILDDEDTRELYQQNSRMKASYDKFCPTCNLHKRYKWQGKTHECDCEMQLSLYKHYLVSGIGTPYQRLSWDDFEDKSELVDWLHKYLDNPQYISSGIGLFFMGDVGAGKTFACMLVLKELVKRGLKCYATTFASMVDTYTAGWYDEGDRKKFSQRVMYSDVLLLDDLGKELRRKNALSESTFDNVLRTRVQGGRPTLITTNMKRTDLGAGYGSSILSLLKESSIEHVFTGDDFRYKAQHRTLTEIENGEVRPII